MSKKKLPPGIDPSKLIDAQRYGFMTDQTRVEHIGWWNAMTGMFWSHISTSWVPLSIVIQVRGPLYFDDIAWLMERTNEEPTSQPNRQRRNPNGRAPRECKIDARFAGQSLKVSVMR